MMTNECEESDTGESDFSRKGGFGAAKVKTARLILQPPGMADIGDIALLCNNREISEMTARIPFPYTIDDARAWVGEIERLSRDGQEFALAIFEREAKKLVGVTGAVALPENSFSIGYWIGEPYWGRGYGTEAVRALIDHLFRRFDAEAVSSNVRVINRNSRGILEKCGFQRMGSGMYRSGRVFSAVPIENYRLERRVWKSLKAWGKGS